MVIYVKYSTITITITKYLLNIIHKQTYVINHDNNNNGIKWQGDYIKLYYVAILLPRNTTITVVINCPIRLKQ